MYKVSTQKTKVVNSTYYPEQHDLAHVKKEEDHPVRHVAVCYARMNGQMAHYVTLSVWLATTLVESASYEVYLVFRCLVRVVRIDKLPVS